MAAIKVRTMPVQGWFKQGPVLCMDIDGAAAPTGSNTRFDVFDPPAGFDSFEVGEFPLAVHPALPGWFDELEQAFAHCAWVSDWGPECVLFAHGAGLGRAALWPRMEASLDLSPGAPLTWHKLDGVRHCVTPEVPVAVVDDSMAPQLGHDPVEDYIGQDLIRFAQRPGPILLLAPAQEIGLTRPLVDLLCRFGHEIPWIRHLPRARCTGATRTSACAGRTRCRRGRKRRSSSTQEPHMTPSDARKHYIADLKAKLTPVTGENILGYRALRSMLRAIPLHPVCEFDEPDENVLVISDLHIGHASVIDYTNRPFRDVDAMDDTLWGNLTAALAPDKVLVVVGDLAMAVAINEDMRQRVCSLDCRRRHPGAWQPRPDGRRPLARAGVR